MVDEEDVEHDDDAHDVETLMDELDEDLLSEIGEDAYEKNPDKARCCMCFHSR